MAGLDTLIQIAKAELDEKRRALTELETRRGGLMAEVNRLAAALEAERLRAKESYEAATAFPAFAKRVRERTAELREQIAELDREIGAATEAVSQAFRDMKKYEIVKERRAEEARIEESRREQQQLDEVGLQGFVRRGRGGV